MKPLVSIITPVYNSEQFIRKMIMSVKKQTFKNWELIVIDDCSKDNSLKILNYYKNSKIKVFKNKKNIGAGLTRNLGLKKAKGRYVTFIDSDDYWHKNYLEKTLNFLRKNNYHFVFSSYYWVSVNGSKKGIFKVPKKVNYNYILRTNPISCLTRMYDKSKLGFISSPKLKIRQDYVFCLKILKKIEFAYGLDVPLAYRRLRTNSLSNNKFISAKYQFRVYYEIEKLGLIKSFYFLLNWFILGLLKHIKNYATS